MTNIISLSYHVVVGTFPRDPTMTVSTHHENEGSTEIFINVSKHPSAPAGRHAIITQELVPLMRSHGLDVSPINWENNSSQHYPVLSLKTKNIIQYFTKLPLSNTHEEGHLLFEHRIPQLLASLEGRIEPKEFQLFIVSGGLDIEYDYKPSSNANIDRINYGYNISDMSNADFAQLLNIQKRI